MPCRRFCRLVMQVAKSPFTVRTTRQDAEQVAAAGEAQKSEYSSPKAFGPRVKDGQWQMLVKCGKWLMDEDAVRAVGAHRCVAGDRQNDVLLTPLDADVGAIARICGPIYPRIGAVDPHVERLGERGNTQSPLP